MKILMDTDTTSRPVTVSIPINTIDPTVIDALGLPDHLLKFAKTQRPNLGPLKGGYTSLCIQSQWIRVFDYHCSHINAIDPEITSVIPLHDKILDVYNAPGIATITKRGLQPYTAFRPEHVVLTQWQRLSAKESVYVHKTLETGFTVIQYQMDGNNSYWLLLRIMEIAKHTDNYVVGTVTLKSLTRVQTLADIAEY